MLEQAIELASQGFHVFPLKPGSKRPMFGAWEDLASDDPDQIRRWWTTVPDANIAIACGPSNLLVIDLDQAKKPGGPRHGQQTLTALAAGRELPGTLTVASARGGRHLYFRQPEGAALRNTAGSDTAGLGPLIDTRGYGGFIVAPGSVFEGGTYRVEHEAAVALLPGWIVEELVRPRRVAEPTPLPAPSRAPVADRRRSAYGNAALNRSADSVATAPEGTRNETLNREAFRVGRLVGGGVLEWNDAVTELRRAAHRAGLPPSEAATTIASGMKAGTGHPRSIPDREPAPRIRQQPEDSVMTNTTKQETHDAGRTAASPTTDSILDVPPENVVEQEPPTEVDEGVEDVWTELRVSFDQVHQMLSDWAGQDANDTLKPAWDTVSSLVARAVVPRGPDDSGLGSFAAPDVSSDATTVDDADELLALVDAAYAEAQSAGISADRPEWAGIGAIHTAVHNLWDTVKTVAGAYWAELSTDMHVQGPLTTIAFRAARVIANLANRAVNHLEQRAGEPQSRAEGAGLREAYINARNQVRAHAATHEWQRITALWGTVNTLARQVDDPGIRAVTARSADAISDHAEALGRKVGQYGNADVVRVLTSLAAAAECHASALRANDVDQVAAEGARQDQEMPISAGARSTSRHSQGGVEARLLQARARQVAQQVQARTSQIPRRDAVSHNPRASSPYDRQSDLTRDRPVSAPQEPGRVQRW